MSKRAQRTFANARVHIAAADNLVDYLQVGADPLEQEEAEKLSARLHKEADRLLDKGHAQLREWEVKS